MRADGQPGSHPSPVQANPEAERADDDEDTAGIDFLDFLFTFVLGFGLVSDRGILSEEWLQTGDWFSYEALRDGSVTLLGISTLTLSWFGYHASIKRQTISYDKISGLLRFQLDAILILLYGVMMLSYEHVRMVLSLFLLRFLIFVLWDVLKAVEYNYRWMRRSSRYYQRDLATVFWTAAAIVVVVLERIAPCDLLYAWSAISISILYRVHKIRAT
jgi:hypothetical protein